MQVLLNTDNHIDGTAAMTEWIESEVKDTLRRFGDQITRVEVHLNDTNSHKEGGRDKRCLMEARLAGLDPIVATEEADSLESAVTGAVKKLQRHLERVIGKLQDRG